MGVKSRSSLKTYNNTNINTNGANGITGTIHNIMNDDIFDSHYNKTDDIGLVGVKNFDATRSYVAGEGVNYNNVYYVALVNNGPAVWDATKWVETRLKRDEFTFNSSNVGTVWTNVSGTIYRYTHNLDTYTPKVIMREPINGAILEPKEIELRIVDNNTIQCNFGFGLDTNDYYTKIEK